MPRNSFHVRVSSIAERKINLSKGKIVAKRGHTVTLLTTVRSDWAQEEVVNAEPLHNSNTDKCEEDDQHLQFKRKEDKPLAVYWKKDIQFIEEYSGRESRGSRRGERVWDDVEQTPARVVNSKTPDQSDWNSQDARATQFVPCRPVASWVGKHESLQITGRRNRWAAKHGMPPTNFVCTKGRIPWRLWRLSKTECRHWPG